jgi:hypothetical protein
VILYSSRLSLSNFLAILYNFRMSLNRLQGEPLRLLSDPLQLRGDFYDSLVILEDYRMILFDCTVSIHDFRVRL